MVHHSSAGGAVLQRVVWLTPVLRCVTLAVYLYVNPRGLTEKMVKLCAPDLWFRRSPNVKLIRILGI